MTVHIFTIFDGTTVEVERAGDECEIITQGPGDSLHLLGSVDAVRRWGHRLFLALEATADSWVDVQIDETATE